MPYFLHIWLFNLVCLFVSIFIFLLTNLWYILVMETMKISSESIPVSSEVIWNRFQIVYPESVSRIDFGIGSGMGSKVAPELVLESAPELVLESAPELVGSGIGWLRHPNWLQNRNRPRNRIWLRNQNQLRNRNRIRHWYRNQNRLRHQNWLRNGVGFGIFIGIGVWVQWCYVFIAAKKIKIYL